MIGSCQVVDLVKIADSRGNLTFLQEGTGVPFPIRRIYYLYDIPGGSRRGGHAHKALSQLIIAISGSFDVELDDGHEKKTYSLNNAYKGLYICPMTWRELSNFSSGAVCLVLASHEYDEADYFREYSEFLQSATRS